MSKIPQIMIFSNNIEIQPYKKDPAFEYFLTKKRVTKLKQRG